MMLEEHLGRATGKILGIMYIIIFIMLAALYLRFFEEFVSNNVLLATPVSLLLMVILIPGFYAIRTGLQAIAQVSEILLLIILPLFLLLFIAGLTEQPDFKNFLPIADINMKNILYSIYLNLWHFGNMIIILILFRFFNQDIKAIRILLIKTLAAMVVFLLFVEMLVTLVVGPELSSIQAFPLSEIARNVKIGGFIRNSEVIFISSFIMGIFVAVTMFWFLACYCTQQIFNLKDYRCLAAPTGIIVGFGSVLISPNTFMTFSILKIAAPLLFGIFFVLIPFLLYVLVLLKPRFNQSSAPKTQDYS